METFIILFRVDSEVDSRRLAERIPNNIEIFRGTDIRPLIVADMISAEVEAKVYEDFYVYPIQFFMDEFNDEQINADDFFMTYVHVTNNKTPQYV